ncbi:MAG: tripartite tricarboxylate transporter substrate binding protein [Burkholderiales bacterium]
MTALFPASATVGLAQGRDANSLNGYPSKPVRMIVPLAPGGGSDIVARILAQALTQHWGQTVVVDNRPGAGSTLGTTLAARAAPDGYTLLVTSSSHAIGPALYPNLWFDVIKDFREISLIASQPSIVAVNPAVRAQTLKELIALLRAEPGKLGFGSAGQGTASHLANELLLITAGVKATHVPYKSAGLASAALLGGEIQFMVTNMATAVPLVRSGKLRGLAVSSARRVASVPDLPTAEEAGLPGYEYTTWYGALAPTGVQKKILAKVNGDIVKLLQSSQVVERFAAQGLDPQPSTPEEFTAYMKSELAKWGRVVKVAGLQVQ